MCNLHHTHAQKRPKQPSGVGRGEYGGARPGAEVVTPVWVYGGLAVCVGVKTDVPHNAERASFNVQLLREGDAVEAGGVGGGVGVGEVECARGVEGGVGDGNPDSGG